MPEALELLWLVEVCAFSPPPWFPGAGRESLDVPLLPGSLGWVEASGCSPPAWFLGSTQGLPLNAEKRLSVELGLL